MPNFPSLTESLAIIIFVPVLCINDSMLLMDLLIHLSSFTMLIEWCCRVSESSQSSKRTSHVMNGLILVRGLIRPRGLILVRGNGVPPRSPCKTSLVQGLTLEKVVISGNLIKQRAFNNGQICCLEPFNFFTRSAYFRTNREEGKPQSS